MEGYSYEDKDGAFRADGTQTGKFVSRGRDLGRAKFFTLRAQTRKIQKIASGAQNFWKRRAQKEKLRNPLAHAQNCFSQIHAPKRVPRIMHACYCLKFMPTAI